jgi:MYXO-CTERM domain-containing protein
MMPASTFQDQCDDISPRIDPKTMMPVPLECTSADHNGCMMGQQNTVADLMAYFGGRTDDTEAPVLSNMQPTDGQDFPLAGPTAMVEFSVEVADADPIVGLSWTIESDVFADQGGSISACTNNHCDVNLIEGDPFKPTDSAWGFPIGLPGGEYAVTLEASDYHGNVTETITYTFTVNGGMGESGGASDTDAMTTGATMTTTTPTTTMSLETTNGATEGDTDDEDDTGPEMMEDDGGCNCTQSPGAGGAFMLILGLFGFAATRRRD